MFLEIILNYVYPNLCGICGKRINYNSFTCEICTSILKYYKERKINSYNEKIDYLLNLYEYKGIIKKQLCQFKFNNQKHIGKFFSKVLTKRILDLNLLFDIIIPVPISKKRYKERGYNQSKILANEIAKTLKRKCFSNILIKCKNNNKQSRLKIDERKENVLGVYKVRNSKNLRNKIVVLIDDIYTTGATINECARVLKLAGAKKIIVATIAYAEKYS